MSVSFCCTTVPFSRCSWKRAAQEHPPPGLVPLEQEVEGVVHARERLVHGTAQRLRYRHVAGGGRDRSAQAETPPALASARGQGDVAELIGARRELGVEMGALRTPPHDLHHTRERSAAVEVRPTTAQHL